MKIGDLSTEEQCQMIAEASGWRERAMKAEAALAAQGDVREARIAELEAENARLSKAVVGGILGELLNDDEEQALIDFVKSLRDGSALATLKGQDNG